MRSKSKSLASLSLFVLTLLVYLKTLAPGVFGFDSAELATGVFTQGIVHPSGYPLYLLIGKLFTFLPFRDIAYRLNLMSAVFASLTVVMLYWVMENITENRFAAWVSALLFAISNYFWQMALIAEVYTPFMAFLAGDILILSLWRKNGDKKYLLAFSLLFGLTLTIHTSAVLFIPAFAWLILRTPHWNNSTWKIVGKMFIFFLIGLIPFAYLLLRANASPAIDYSKIYSGVDLTTISGLWWMISGEAYAFFAFAYTWVEIPGELIRFIIFLWRNYFGIGVIVGVIGIVWLWRKDLAGSIGLLFVFFANVIFYANYRVIDKDTMFLPAYAMWAVFIAGGLTAIYNFIDQSTRQYLNGFWLMKLVKIFYVGLVFLGLGLNWRWVDMSKVDNYSMFAEEMMALAVPQSVVIAPWSSAVVLEYYQVIEGQRPDLLIVNSSRLSVARYYELWQQGLSHEKIMKKIDAEKVDFIDKYIQEKTVYAVEYDPEIARKFEYLPEGPAFKLTTP